MRNTIDLVSHTPTTLYHTAPLTDRQTIMDRGLRAEGDGIFFDEHVPDRKPEIDVWEVDARGLPIYSENGVWVDWTDTVIPPSRLNLLADRIDEKAVVEKAEPIMEAWFGPALLWRNAMTKWLETQPIEAKCSFEMQGGSSIFAENVGHPTILQEMTRLADRYEVVITIGVAGKRREALERYSNYGFEITSDDMMVRQPQAEPHTETQAEPQAEPLTEMPIGNITRLGDWDKNSSFQAQDRKLLSNDKAITKIKSMWKGPEEVTFNIMLVNHAEGRAVTGNQEVGFVDHKWLGQNMPRCCDDIWNNTNKDAVNIVYTNNNGAERVPLTGWTMAHRLGHALQRTNGGVESYYFQEALKTAYRYIEGWSKEYRLPTKKPGYSNPLTQLNANQNRLALLRAICTFRSARENNIRTPFEAVLEMFAQYLVTGKIKFNPLPMSIKWGPSTYGYRSLDDLDHDSNSLADLAQELEDYFETAIHYAVGKILVM